MRLGHPSKTAGFVFFSILVLSFSVLLTPAGCKQADETLPPAVDTVIISEITDSSALLGGVVVSDGGSPVVKRGLVWNKTGSPTLEMNDGEVHAGFGTGRFNSRMDHLDENTIYYARAFASNSEGTAYALQQSFRTRKLILKPAVTTQNVSDVADSSVQAEGNVLSDGGDPVVERGICWSTKHGPTIDGNKIAVGSGTGSFSTVIHGLGANTIIYIRAYATNSMGTSYGTEVSAFYSAPVSDSEGNSYQTVRIGDQVWFKDNLKSLHPNGELTNYCWYDLDSAKYHNLTGTLYQVINVSWTNVCPTGWHVPTSTEWMRLFEYLGGPEVAGGKLKEQGTEHWASPNTEASNQSGFTALPGGYRGDKNAFIESGLAAYFASSKSPNDWTNGGWVVELYYRYQKVVYGNISYYYWVSVRCMRDE
ncbi:MAG: FISUMP domain-containing protein [Bacteroidales bacterium]